MPHAPCFAACWWAWAPSGARGAHGGFGHATTPDVRLDAVSFELPSGDCVSHDAAVNQPVVTAATAVAQAVFVRTTQAQPDERRFNLAVRFAVDPVAQ